MQTINMILFPNFETLDAFGPAEIFGRLGEEFQMKFYSQEGGLIASSQGVRVMTKPLTEIKDKDVLFVPGGMGTRTLSNNSGFLSKLGEIAAASGYVLSVCTGSALLAQAGVLKNKKATSNKRVFSWVSTLGENVHWIEKARWVVDGNVYTSSGVSAGMDMALGFVADRLGKEKAQQIAYDIEYVWNDDPGNDPFVRA